TVVSQEAFVRSRAVDKSVIVVPRERLDQARVVGSTARVVPDRHSVLGRPDIMTVRRPPPIVTTREVVVRREPPPPPVPFMERERALRAHPGRPLDETTLGTLRRQSPPARTKPLVRPAVPVATPAPAPGRDARTSGPRAARRPACSRAPRARRTSGEQGATPAAADAGREARSRAPRAGATCDEGSPRRAGYDQGEEALDSEPGHGNEAATRAGHGNCTRAGAARGPRTRPQPRHAARPRPGARAAREPQRGRAPRRHHPHPP